MLIYLLAQKAKFPAKFLKECHGPMLLHSRCWLQISIFLQADRPHFFLHGWRRHVCRNCTGHLVLQIRELPARYESNKTRKRTTNQTKHKPQANAPTKNQPKNKQASWHQATRVSHAKVRREKKSETWGSQLAKGLSVHQDNPLSKVSLAERHGAVALLKQR